MVLVKGTVGFPELRKQGWRTVKSMASSELPFGPRSGSDPSVYLDTSHSDVVDATTSELPLYIPGENFVFEASFERLGSDLLLIRDGHSVLVKGYFTHQRAPDLYTSDGNSFVPGSEAASLAGPATPGEFAQLVVGSPEGRIKVADSSERVPQPCNQSFRLHRPADLFIAS